jgi:hypothetical protein
MFETFEKYKKIWYTWPNIWRSLSMVAFWFMVTIVSTFAATFIMMQGVAASLIALAGGVFVAVWLVVKSDLDQKDQKIGE